MPVWVADYVVDPRAALELDDRELVYAAGGGETDRLERVDRLSDDGPTEDSRLGSRFRIFIDEPLDEDETNE